MKKFTLVAVTLFLFWPSVWAQQVERPEATQNPNVPYRLFNTTNIYTFLQLDTRNGRVWQLQWGKTKDRLVVPINARALVANETPGRFTLYSTKNMYTYILLDQETGESWQVQWSVSDDRFREPIASVD